MAEPNKPTRQPLLDRLNLRKPPGSRVPEDSYFYKRILPALIVVLGVVMVLLIVFAIGVYIVSLS